MIGWRILILFVFAYLSYSIQLSWPYQLILYDHLLFSGNFYVTMIKTVHCFYFIYFFRDATISAEDFIFKASDGTLFNECKDNIVIATTTANNNNNGGISRISVDCAEQLLRKTITVDISTALDVCEIEVMGEANVGDEQVVDSCAASNDNGEETETNSSDNTIICGSTSHDGTRNATVVVHGAYTKTRATLLRTASEHFSLKPGTSHLDCVVKCIAHGRGGGCYGVTWLPNLRRCEFLTVPVANALAGSLNEIVTMCGGRVHIAHKFVG